MKNINIELVWRTGVEMRKYQRKYQIQENPKNKAKKIKAERDFDNILKMIFQKYILKRTNDLFDMEENETEEMTLVDEISKLIQEISGKILLESEIQMIIDACQRPIIQKVKEIISK